MRRLHPGVFLVPVTGLDGKTVTRLAINPFANVDRAKYAKTTAIPSSRAEMQALAKALIEHGHPGLAVAATICFEWVQRPEDVRAGRLTWDAYRPADRPNEVRIIHNKTGEEVWQPLETKDGRKLYPEIEDLLAKLPRLGGSLVMFDATRAERGKPGTRQPRLYSNSYAQHVIQKVRKLAGLPAHVTLESCRHGGMTELGDAELTEQEIMATSGHLTPKAARLYIKRTKKQVMSGAVKRRNLIEEIDEDEGGESGPA